MKQNNFFLGAIAIGAMFLVPSISSASIQISEYSEKSNGNAADDSNHRMEDAFAISDSDFTASNIGDWVDIQGFGNLNNSSDEYGDTYRAYLYAGVTYSVKTNPNDRYSTGTSLSDVIQDTTLTVINGGATAAFGSNFDFSGYEIIGANDNGVAGDNVLPESSALEFTVATSGYHYFFVSNWAADRTDPATSSSVDYDRDVLKYSGYGPGDGVFGLDADGFELNGGLFYTGTNTPTGSVLGGLVSDDSYWLRIEHVAGDSPGVNPVPEPSSIAIFSVIGIGGLMLRRRMKSKK